MRHQHGYRKLGRPSYHRRAMLRNMTTSFFVKQEDSNAAGSDWILNGKVKTTLPKAKELRRLVEKMITLGKRGDNNAKSQVGRYVFNPAAVRVIFDDLAGRYKDRPGGYTRILRHGPRFGDGAEMVTLELVGEE